MKALRAVTSVHFQVSHVEGGTDLGGGILLTSVEGDAKFPNGASMRAQGRAFNAPVQFGIVQTGDLTYFCGPLGCIWRTVDPGTLPFDFVGMHDSVADALAATTAVSIEEAGDVNGVPTYLLTGRLLSETIRGLVPGALEGNTLEIAVFVGRDDLLPRSVRLSGLMFADDPPGMTRLLDLADFNDPVSIEPPI